MINIDGLVKDLDDLVTKILYIQSNKSSATRYQNSPASLIFVSVNLTTRSLDDLVSSDIREQVYHNIKGDPLIDVIETDKKIRIIATLPRIKTEDVLYNVKDGILTVEIIKYGQLLKKEIKCSDCPGQILLRSSTVNNSVLELVFDKA